MTAEALPATVARLRPCSGLLRPVGVGGVADALTAVRRGLWSGAGLETLHGVGVLQGPHIRRTSGLLSCCR